MSGQDVNSSTAITPQHSIITSTTSEEDAHRNIETTNKDAVVESSFIVNDLSDENNDNHVEKDRLSESDNQVVRSESVIKSTTKPLFVSSSTPVIKVVGASFEPVESESNFSDEKVSTGVTVIAQVPSNQSTSPLNSASFLHSTSSFAPANPFLRTSSFSSNFISSSENSESNSESSIIFAPPRLIPSSFSSQNPLDTSRTFLRPSVLRVADSSNSEDTGKSKETISTSRTFISLNKEDIGQIKTPVFVSNSLESNSSTVSNGSSSSSKFCEDVNACNEVRPFVFGQKLQDRVVIDINSTAKTDVKSLDSTSLLPSDLISFSDVTSCETSLKDTSSDSIKSDDSNKNESDSCANTSNVKNGEYSESPFKRKYSVITGEEDEQNVLSIHGRLYAWDAERTNWVEKGCGNLRLNDIMKNERLCSRLVMRTSGALRLILNAHIVAGMKFELSNDNCLRFTYVDGIYLIKANPKDIDQLNSAIEYRLREITKRVKTFDSPELNDDNVINEEEPSGESV